MTASTDTSRPWAYLSWPNRISLLRLIMVAPFILLLRQQQSVPVCRYLALGTFVLLALSDGLDGYLARRLNRKTRLGSILDPLADKVLIICAAVLLALPRSAVVGTKLPDWVVVMIVGKDLWVIIGFLLVFLLTGRVHVVPSLPGKLCTFAQLLMVGLVLLSPDLNRLGWQIGSWLAWGAWWATGVLCGLSVVSYSRIGIAIVAEADAKNAAGGPDQAA